MSKKNLELRDDCSKLKHSLDYHEEQYKLKNDRLKADLVALKKEVRSKDNHIQDIKGEVKIHLNKISSLESKIKESLSENKKLEHLYEVRLNGIEGSADL